MSAPAPAERIHIGDLEAAINHWRAARPAGAGAALAPEVRALAESYAHACLTRRDWLDAAALSATARAAWLAWYATMPDTPCVALCSTAQGDAICRGCGRTEDEVRHRVALSPYAKRAVWQRLARAPQRLPAPVV